MNAPGWLKRALKRSKWATVAARIARDRSWLVREKLRVGNPSGGMGATHRGYELQESVDYVEGVFDDYLRYGGLSREELPGKVVLELGPGDSFGVALLLLAAGVERVETVDRIVAHRDPEYQSRLYAALLERLDAPQRARAEAALEMDGEITFAADRLRVREGVTIEEAAAEFGPESFDLIVSRAVVEHIYDTDTAFAEMRRLLRPHGLMSHKVDLRDHGLLSGEGLHSLTFLSIPAPLYKMMVVNTGQPNRKLLPYYRDLMERLGLEARFLVTHLVGRDEEIRPHLETPPASAMRAAEAVVEEARGGMRSPFREMSAADLAVAGIFLSARRP